MVYSRKQESAHKITKRILYSIVCSSETARKIILYCISYININLYIRVYK